MPSCGPSPRISTGRGLARRGAARTEPPDDLTCLKYVAFGGSHIYQPIEDDGARQVVVGGDEVVPLIDLAAIVKTSAAGCSTVSASPPPGGQGRRRHERVADANPAL